MIATFDWCQEATILCRTLRVVFEAKSRRRRNATLIVRFSVGASRALFCLCSVSTFSRACMDLHKYRMHSGPVMHILPSWRPAVHQVPTDQLDIKSAKTHGSPKLNDTEPGNQVLFFLFSNNNSIILFPAIPIDTNGHRARPGSRRTALWPARGASARSKLSKNVVP